MVVWFPGGPLACQNSVKNRKPDRQNADRAFNKILATTYSPVPSPVKYHRPCGAYLLCSEWEEE